MELTEEHSRILTELHHIQAAIELLTPLRSNWNGEIRLETIVGEKGSKPFICEIVIRPDLISKPIRWRTMIHESFHACSAGYNFHDYNANIGWEEGIVEKLERLFRKRILNTIGVEMDLTIFEAVDRNHPFDLFITPLEKIRVTMAREPDEFYLSMIRIPIRDRYARLVEMALRMYGSDRRNLLNTLSSVRHILEGKLP